MEIRISAMVMVKMGIFVVRFHVKIGKNFRLTIKAMENLDFGRGHGRNFDHLTMIILKFWPWSWSKIFDHMTMTPRRRPNGQKIMVALRYPSPQFRIYIKYFVYYHVMKTTTSDPRMYVVA